jgi:hypothetical protein
MRKQLGIIASCFLTLLVAACSGGDDNQNTPSDLTLDEFLAKVEDARCTSALACNQFASEADCRATTRIESGQIDASIKAGRAKYDPTKAGACIDAVAATSCSLSALYGASDLQSCLSAIAPQVADGQACAVDAECISQKCEATDPNCSMACCPGTCTAKPAAGTAKIGEACGADTACVSGAYCKTDAMGKGTCAAQEAEGQPCTGFDSCKSPALCALNVMTFMGTCKVPAAHGADCDPATLFSCDRTDDYCDPMTKKCTLGKAPGEACGNGVECIPYAVCNAGKCEKKGVMGSKCDPMAQDPDSACLGDLLCQKDSTCQFGQETVCQ